MKIYFDADCGICTKIKNYCEKLLRKNSQLVFLDINTSPFKDEVMETIVFVDSDNKEYRYGYAVQKIFSEFIFPLNFLKFIPTFFLNPFYIFLRFLRNKYSKKICKI